MYLSGSQKILKSMNGLLKISATDIDATNASITNINNVENISGAIGSDLVIDVDTGKIIQLKDDVQMDTNLNVIGNIHAGGKLDISGNSTFDGNVFANLNLHSNTFDVSNASIFNGSITCKQITSNGVCNFNNPVLTNSSLVARSIDASNTSVFRSNLNVLGPINCTQNVTFDKDLVLTSSANQFSVFCSSSTLDGSLNVKGVLDVSRNSIFRNNLDVSSNLYVGRNNPNNTSTVDLTGQFLIREPSNPNVLNMTIKYEPTLAGWRFINNNANGFVYFSVKNSAGTIRNFQFSFSQLYSNINSYYDCEVNFTFNKQLTLGDTNFAGSWFGSRIIYIPSVQPHDGLVFYNKGLNNNVAYYTNFTHNNLSNVEVPTFRMNHNNIWSKVPHTMESTLSVAGNLTLTGNLIANSTTITPVQLSYLNGASSNIQTQLNNKLDLTGGTISGNLTISGTTTLNAQLNLNDVLYVDSTTILPVHLSYLAGASSNLQTQLNGKLNSLGTTLSGSLTFADATIQSTAYTTADDTKLQVIGTVTTATLNADFSLTTNVIYSPGSMSLSAGTYMITVNAGVNIIGGANLVGQLQAGYSTSSTAFSQNINLAIEYAGVTGNTGNKWTLNSSNIITVASTTTYYLLVQCSFGTAGRLQYTQANSQFSAVRIA